MDTDIEAKEDIETVRAAISSPDMHAIHHLNGQDEINSLWVELEAQQEQIDSLFEKLLKIGL